MNKKHLKSLVFPISLLFLILIIYNIGFSTLYNSILSADPFYFYLAVALHLASIVVRSIKWKIYVNGVTKTSFLSLLIMVFAGGFIDNATPGPQIGGGPIKAYFLSKRIKKDKSVCLSTIVIERLTGVGMIFIFGIFSTFFVLIFIQKIPLMLKLLLEFLLFIVLGLPIIGYVSREKYVGKGLKGHQILSKIYRFGPFSFLRKKFKSLQSFESYVNSKIKEFRDTFVKLSHDKGRVRMDVILAFVMWMIVFLKTYVLFLALNSPVSFFAVMVVVSLSIFISYFLFMPGGMGVTELLMILLYSSFGISSATAASVALLDRFIFYVFSFGVGYISLIYLNYRYGKEYA